MPGMYHVPDYDLAGFAVGVVDEDEIIDGSKVKVGDTLVAIASSGPHSNGYSLVRKVLEFSKADPNEKMSDGRTLIDTLLTPTRIYVKPILSLMKECKIHALAHITGGGFWENIPRVLPKGTKAVCESSSWEWPEVFQWLQKNGNIDTHEMYRTFNCGVGMVVALDAADAQKAVEILNNAGEKAWVIGSIAEAKDGEEQVNIN